ncbi:MAG TPA: cyclase family protein [Candidatus Brocadiaceae bacterium]
MANFFDITLPITNTLLTWPADPPVFIQKTNSISHGDSCNISELKFGSHCGTHIDAPCHYEDDGIAVDQIPLDYLIGKATVFEIQNREKIGLAELKSLQLKNTQRILFKTVNSAYWNLPVFQKDFVYITGEAARRLVDCGVRLVGIDYLSVDKFLCTDTHHILLKNGVIILEGLDLRVVTAGEYELFALPLKIKGGDGSPARVILRTV